MGNNFKMVIKTFFKILKLAFLSFLSFMLLCIILIYLPPVQQLVFNRINSSLVDKIGYNISAEKFYISLPLNIHIRNLKVLDLNKLPSDSSVLLNVVTLDANIGISNIFAHELSINRFRLKTLNLNYKKDSSNINIKTHLDTLNLDLKLKGTDKWFVKIKRLYISDSDIALLIDNKYNNIDSVVERDPMSLSLEWDNITLHNITYNMSGKEIPSINTNFDDLSITRGNYNLRDGALSTANVKLNNGNIKLVDIISDSTFKLQANNIIIELDSIYNKGDVIRGNFRKLSFNHPSGLNIKDGSANSKFEENSTDLSLFFLKTANSELKLNLIANDNYTNLFTKGRLSLDLDAYIGIRDILPFYTNIPDTLLNNSIKILGRCSLSSKELDITSLTISLDDKLELSCDGSIDLDNDFKKLNGKLNIEGNLKDMSFLKNIFGDDYIVPNDTRFFSDIDIYNGTWGGEFYLQAHAKHKDWKNFITKDIFKLNSTSNITDSIINISQINGNIVNTSTIEDSIINTNYIKDSIIIAKNLNKNVSSLKIEFLFSPENSNYSANLNFNKFEISDFLPNYNLGEIDGNTTLVFHYPLNLDSISSLLDSITFSGESKFRSLEYNSYVYRDIALNLSFIKGKYNLNIDSKDKNANLNLNLLGEVGRKYYLLDWKGEIKKINLFETNFSTSSLAFASKLMGHFEMGDKTNLYTTFAKFRVDDNNGIHNLGALMLNARGDNKNFNIDFFSGDFRINVNSKASLEDLLQHISYSAGLFSEQLSQRTFDLKYVLKDFPSTKFNIKGGQRNLLGDFMAGYGIGMKSIKGNLSITDEANPLDFNLAVNRIYYNDFVLDSLIVNTAQVDSLFSYNVDLYSTVVNGGIDSRLKFFGDIEKNTLSFFVERYGGNKKLAFKMGANVEVVADSSYNIKFLPLVPIISYAKWNLNKDNFININKDKKITANVFLSNSKKSEFVCTSLTDEGNRTNRLKIKLSNIVLDSLSKFIKLLPPTSGNLKSEVYLYSAGDSSFMHANLFLDTLHYNNQEVGNIHLGGQYFSYKNLRELDATMSINNINSINLKGDLRDDKILNGKLKISDLALKTLNPFLPKGSIKLFGTMDSDITAKGNVENPLIDGSTKFKNASLFLDLLGSSYDIESSALKFDKNKLEIKELLLRASDSSNMSLSGNIDFMNLDKIYTSLDIKADNFQLVNVKEDKESIISGKAYIDMLGRIRGDFSNLNISGRVKMLNSSNIVYTMHDTELQIEDKTEDLISFVPFRDSSLLNDRFMTPKKISSAYKMTTLISIGNDVSVKLNLSEKEDNNILIQGGGYLLFSMNPEEGAALSGKYTINKGMVNYNVPLAGKQSFSIIKGSNVEWTGNIMVPLLNISAAENVRASVSSGSNDNNRIVSMNAIIKIGNNLNRPDISFDIDTPNDMVIKNELSQLNSEERAKKAMNLIIYKSYSGIDESSSKTMTDMASNSLYSFVENELNRYTARTGFTFGIDSYSNIGTENGQKTRTDYSYQYNKTLFNDKVNVTVGGRVSTNDNSESSSSIENTIVDDLSIEYMLNKRKNLYLKVFRYTNYENVLEGDITSTGLGIVFKRSFRRFKILFKGRKEKIDEEKEDEEVSIKTD